MVKKGTLRRSLLINVVCSENHFINYEGNKKLVRYAQLEISVEKVRNLKISVIPIVIGVLGFETKNFQKYLEKFAIFTNNTNNTFRNSKYLAECSVNIGLYNMIRSRLNNTAFTRSSLCI